MRSLSVLAILLMLSLIEAFATDAESICFHSAAVQNPSQPPVRGPVGKAGPIGPTGPPGPPGHDAVCNYDNEKLDAINNKIDEMESKPIMLFIIENLCFFIYFSFFDMNSFNRIQVQTTQAVV